MNPLLSVAIFLVQTLFNLYLFVLMIRFLLQAVRAEFYQPSILFIAKLTDPLITPLQKIIPPYRTINLSILVLMWLIVVIKITLIVLLESAALPQVSGLVIASLVDLIGKFLNFYVFAIIVRVLLSWLAPAHHHPFYFMLYQLTEPLLRPARRLLPLLGGFDFSPILVIIVLQALAILVSSSLNSLV